ncbi:MAG: methyltransferase domain-containing protein [Thermodesulfobacteriota bacterium]
MEQRRRRAAIAQAYDAVGAAGSRPPAGMGFPTGAALARELGYPEAAVSAAPPALLDAFVGASALAPSLMAEGRPGELVLDLGCGAGLDAWLLARAGYRVAALDACASMLSRLAGLGDSAPRGLRTVRAELPSLPIRDGIADWVLLNGVANLIGEREALWREVCRVLAPGGRLLAADLVALGPVPPELRALPEAWAWCLGGAPEASRWAAELEGAGLDAPRISILEEIPPFARAVAEARRPG